MGSDRPTVSVIIATFNAAPGLRRSIESVLRQVVPAEVVIADGGSTDDTVAIADSYARQGHPIVVDRARDLSVYDAMNRALESSQGRYLHYLGAGDTLRPGALEALVGVVGDGDREVLAYGDVWFAAMQRFSIGAFDGARFAARFGICHQAILWDRRTIERLGGYDLRHRVHADHLLTMRAFGDPAVEPIYVPVVVANFEGGGISDLRPDPGTGIDFPRIVRESFGIDVPAHAWGERVWPPADLARRGRDVDVHVGAVVAEGAWRHLALEIRDDENREVRPDVAWVGAPDGYGDGALHPHPGGGDGVRVWVGSWPTGRHRCRVEVVTVDGRRGTADCEITIDADGAEGVTAERATRPSPTLAEARQRQLDEVAVVTIWVGRDDPAPGGGTGAADLVVAGIDAGVVEAAHARLADLCRPLQLVVVADAGCELTWTTVPELVAEYRLAPHRALLFGDEAGTGRHGPPSLVLKPGFAPSHALAQDVVGPVLALDPATLASAVAAGPAPIRSVGELVTRVVDLPVAARRIPRVLARRDIADVGPLVDGALAALRRRGHDDATSAPIPEAWPPAHDVRWRPKSAGRVSLVATVPLGEPASSERLRLLHRSAAAAWPSVELVIVDSSVTAFDSPADAVVVRGPRSGASALAWNLGVAASSGDTVVLVDEWTEGSSDDWLPLLLMHLDDEWVSAAGALVLAPDLDTVRSGGLWLHPEVGPARLLARTLTELERTGAGRIPRAVSAVHGTGIAVRRERWEALGGFRTDLPGHLHEVDLCRRSQTGGARVVVEPRSRLVHHGVVSELWPWDDAIAADLATAAAGAPDPESEHGHPLMDWRRPGRAVYFR